MLDDVSSRTITLIPVFPCFAALNFVKIFDLLTFHMTPYPNLAYTPNTPHHPLNVDLNMDIGRQVNVWSKVIDVLGEVS